MPNDERHCCDDGCCVAETTANAKPAANTEQNADRAPDAHAVRSQVRAAFADDDPAWFDAVSTRFDEVVGAATTALSVPS